MLNKNKSICRLLLILCVMLCLPFEGFSQKNANKDCLSISKIELSKHTMGMIGRFGKQHQKNRVGYDTIIAIPALCVSCEGLSTYLPEQSIPSLDMRVLNRCKKKFFFFKNCNPDVTFYFVSKLGDIVMAYNAKDLIYSNGLGLNADAFNQKLLKYVIRHKLGDIFYLPCISHNTYVASDGFGRQGWLKYLAQQDTFSFRLFNE